MYSADFLRAEYLMSLIVEDFNLDEEYMKINQIFLNEDSSPVELITKLDNKDKDNKEESDEAAEDVIDLMDIDKLADKLEDPRFNLTIEDEPDRFNVNISPNDDIDDDIADLDNIANSLNLVIKDKVNDDSTINLTLKNSAPNDINLKIDDDLPDNDINLNIKQDIDSDADIHLKLTDTSSDSNDNEIKLTLKNTKDLTPEEDSGVVNVKLSDDPKDADGDIHIKLMNTENEADDKISSFINKRDELLSQDDSNLQLSTCLKIVVNLKKSLERLINYVPDEVILTQTKYILGDILDNLIDNSSILLKDKERLKKVIYKIFDIVISINKYIEEKYVEIEDKIDSHEKDRENQLISKQITNVETIKKQEQFKREHNIVTAEDKLKMQNQNNSAQQNQLSQNPVNTSDNQYNNTDQSISKKPNINHKRI